MRKIILVLASCIVLLLVGYTGYRSYQVWEQKHGLTMASQYFAKSDMRNTMLALRQVLAVNPRNIEACRMMAGLTEMARSPASLVWHQRVLELNPKSFTDRLSLAQAAIIFQEYPLATNTLAGVADTDKETPAYQNVAGSVALMGGKPDEAETHFSESIRLDPTNAVPQVNLAVVRLHRTNTLDMAEARIALQRVILNSQDASLRSQARRELIMDAMRFKDFPTALALSQELAEQTNSVFTDKILRLDVLMKTLSPEFKPALASFQREAATNSAKIFDLANWEMNQRSPAETLDWLQSLPPLTRTNQPAEVLAAQCQMQLADWRGLQSALQKQNWNELEFMRHAYTARALREQGLTEATTAEWGVALNSASSQKGSLISLFRLAAAWKWNTEGEQILWIVVNRYPEEKWAPAILSQALMAWHRTRSMQELFSIMQKRSPNDLEIKNNLAMTAMLLGSLELNPYGLSQQVYEKAPTNSSYASTYAFSLYLQKKYADALKVMQRLPAKDLEDPSIAGYYGLILKANGDKAQAEASLNRISATQLMPEEQKLFEQAKAGL
jgi:Flp pilus assembly protein TadD